MGNSSNFDPQHENYYTRLGLEENAPPEDIKKAFFNAVKIYPPEKDPENSKLIREAYDTLFHSISRTEYDTKKKFGSVLENLENNLQDAEEDEDIDEQIRILKKILNIAPKLGIYRNKLGLVFMEKEQFGYAYNQFKKAHNIDSENLVYILNMGHAETERGNYVEAEKHFIQAWDLDREDHSAPRALASLYFEKLNRKRKAHNILDEAIEADAKVDFQDFFCIYDKVHFYALDKNQAGLKRELERIKDVSSKKEEKEFASFMLYRTGGQLFDLKIFDLAIHFLKTANILMPEDSDIEEFYKQCLTDSERIKSFEKLADSDDIHKLVKSLVGLYLGRYYKEIDDQEFHRETKEWKDILINIMDTSPDCDEVKESLRYIRQNHDSIYNINSGLFDRLLNFPAAKKYKEKCPYSSCRKYVVVQKLPSFSDPMDILKIDPFEAMRSVGYGEYNCPHCNNTIKYGSSGFSTVSIFTNLMRKMRNF